MAPIFWHRFSAPISGMYVTGTGTKTKMSDTANLARAPLQGAATWRI